MVQFTVNDIGLVYLPMVINEHSQAGTQALSSTEFGWINVIEE
jgi:hypothetical protein